MLNTLLLHNFIVYDKGSKKITCYQQYFALKETIAQIKTMNENGKRRKCRIGNSLKKRWN